MKRDLFWADIITRVAQNSAMTYGECKRLDIDEFFVLLMNYEHKMKQHGRRTTEHTSENKRARRKAR
ncbi:MAG TPA: hypothetical protein DEQ09_08955 [Bacteroidales bacterium]|nr:hypothetical protein [Bacteroidales bacterium]